MGKFNLIDEGWIECVDLYGTERQVGIREIILNSHKYRQFISTIPLVNASVMFLLETLIIRVLSTNGIHCDSAQEWWQGFQKGYFSAEPFEAYFQRWHDRFYLLDEQRPFWQVIIDDPKCEGTAMKLLPHFSGGTGGNSALLFDQHTMDKGVALSYPEAARYLLAAHYYGAGGRIIGPDYFSDSAISAGLAFFLEGCNLFETLYLNLLPYPTIPGIVYKPDDKPIWERDYGEVPARLSQNTEKYSLYQPTGLLDMLTWESHYLQLIETENNMIHTIRMKSGLRMTPQNFPWFAYNEKGNYLRPRSEYAIWRDFTVLLQYKKMAVDETPQLAPVPVRWLHELSGHGFMPEKVFTIRALGMSKESGKQQVHFYSAQSLPLPSEYFTDPELIAGISYALELAKKIDSSVYQASSFLAERVISPDKDKKAEPNTKKNLQNHLGAQRQYWEVLGAGFFQLVISLPGYHEGAIEIWKKLIIKAGRDALEYAITMAGESINVFKASVGARNILEKGFKEQIGSIEKEIQL